MFDVPFGAAAAAVVVFVLVAAAFFRLHRREKRPLFKILGMVSILLSFAAIAYCGLTLLLIGGIQ